MKDDQVLVGSLEALADLNEMIHCESWVTIQGYLRAAAKAIRSSEAEQGICPWCHRDIRKEPVACDNCPASSDTPHSGDEEP